MGEESKKNTYRSIKDESLSASQLTGGLDKHLTAGYYQVEINHTTAGDVGLPAGTCSREHYVTAHLLVTESGTDKALQKNRKVGQVLFLTGCAGNVTQIYTRCGNRSAGGCLWGSWSPVVKAADIQKFEKHLPTEVAWGAASNINSYVEAGTYIIKGERLSTNDGLPIANSSPGHTIAARLVVLNSSISGTGDSQDKCVTQILTLSNRTGGDGDVYIRTGSSSSINRLVGGNGWEQWGKLQQNIEVGQVTSLDGFTGNGVYSGVYTNGSTFFETFVMVVINNYAVAGKTGAVRSISQFKYALNVDGTFSYKTRTGQGNTGISWGNWVEIDNKAQLAVETEKQRATAAETKLQNSIDALVAGTVPNGTITADKLSAEVKDKVDNPLRPLYIASGAEYNESTGNYELNGIADLTESDMIYIYEYKNYHFSLNTARYFQENKNVRTIFPMNTVNTVYDQLFKNNKLSLVCTFMNSNFEVIKFSKSQTLEQTKGIPTESGSMSGMFTNAKKLKTVYPIDVSAVTSIGASFDGTIALIDVRLCGLKCSAIFKDSTNISKESVLYMMQYALPTSAIAITLHPDAYSRLADDADIVAALEAQPLVSLVSA